MWNNKSFSRKWCCSQNFAFIVFVRQETCKVKMKKNEDLLKIVEAVESQFYLGLLKLVIKSLTLIWIKANSSHQHCWGKREFEILRKSCSRHFLQMLIGDCRRKKSVQRCSGSCQWGFWEDEKQFSAASSIPS